MADQSEQLRRFMERGLAAQKAMDAAVAKVKADRADEIALRFVRDWICSLDDENSVVTIELAAALRAYAREWLERAANESRRHCTGDRADGHASWCGCEIASEIRRLADELKVRK